MRSLKLKEIVKCLLLLAIVSLTSSPVRADAVVTSPRDNPRLLALAKQWFYRFQNGNIDRKQLDDRVNAQMTDAMIQQESVTLKAFGHPIRFVYLGSERVEYAIGYHFGVIFSRGRILESIALDEDGKVAGFNFQTFVPAK